MDNRAPSVTRVQGMPDITPVDNSHKYLIETNPALTDLKQFMSSDYLLGKLGYNPDASWKRLGDGLYEQRLIREAVVARTGQRYINGLASDDALFRYLMDNAISYKDSLNLQLGVSLTAEQVAALTHDIVWMEEAEVNGQKVLTPVLYLAQTNNRLAPNGALIQGQDVSLITGGDLHNSGTLRATNNLSMVANNIDNSGLMQAGNRLEMLATDSIRNSRGGIINGRDISATAVTGDIINERTVTTFKQEGQGYQLRNDVASEASRFEATGTLKLNAGRDVLNLGSNLKAGGNASVTAGRDVLIASQTEQDDYVYQRRRISGTEQTILQHASVVDVGGNLAIDARRDIAVVASTVSAAKDLSVKAGENLTLAAAANEQHDYSKGKKGGTKTTTQLDDVTQQSAELKAGGDLIAIAGTDLTLVASKISAGKADPQLAWLKEAEQRGDVDWRQVKELHDSFKYSNSGLGAGAQIIIAIIVTYFTMGAASGAIAAAGSGTSMASATAVGTAATSAGWANAAGSTVLAGMASNGAISAINNRGNLSTVLKDVTSSDAMKGYVVSGVTAGLTAGVYDKWTGTQTGTSTALSNSGAVATVSPLSTWQGVGQFTANQVLQNGTSLLVDRALGGEARLGDALQSSLANAFAAYGFNLVGDISKNRFAEGGITKIGLHALMGGLAAEASGGDFRTGALAAGVNEALLDSLAKNYADMPDDQKKGLLVMNSQLLGVLAASVQGDADAKNLQTGAWVAGNATQYNYLFHQEVEEMTEEVASKKTEAEKNEVRARYAQLDEARNGELRSVCQAAPAACDAASNRLIADEPKLRELAKSLYAQGHTSEATTIAAIIISNNTTATLTIATELAALRDGDQSSFWDAAAGTLLGASLGGMRPSGGGVGAKATVSSPLKLGETKAINEVSMTRVGRWMSPAELAQMQNTNKVVQGAGGQTFISTNGIADFKGAAPKGSVYVEFDVPANSLLQGGKDGWFKMIGPEAGKSQQFMLNKQGGEHLPAIKNIEVLDKK
ncbi:DUF637 domain-containing protein [Pseudomonas fluorescens]